jgi:hypothetical protein
LGGSSGAPLAGEEVGEDERLTMTRFVARDGAERSSASRPGGAVARRPLELRSGEGSGTGSATNDTRRWCGDV